MKYKEIKENEEIDTLIAKGDENVEEKFYDFT